MIMVAPRATFNAVVDDLHAVTLIQQCDHPGFERHDYSRATFDRVPVSAGPLQ